MLTFGKWLRDKRIAAGLTQEEAAKRAGLTRAMWAKLEGDESGTRREKIPGIAQAIEANLAETYERAGYAPPLEAGDAACRRADVPPRRVAVPCADP